MVTNVRCTMLYALFPSVNIFCIAFPFFLLTNSSITYVCIIFTILLCMLYVYFSFFHLSSICPFLSSWCCIYSSGTVFLLCTLHRLSQSVGFPQKKILLTFLTFPLANLILRKGVIIMARKKYSSIVVIVMILIVKHTTWKISNWTRIKIARTIGLFLVIQSRLQLRCRFAQWLPTYLF